MTPDTGQVTRRHVIFLSGFDPKGASYYHALYRAEALKQAPVNGMATQVGLRQRTVDGNSTWAVSASWPDGSRCETTLEFVRWDDIVRRHWPRTLWHQLKDIGVACTVALRGYAVVPVWKMSRRTLAALAFPVVFLGGGLALSLGIGAVVARLLYEGAYVGTLTGLKGSGGVVAAAGGLLALGLGLWCTRLLEARFNPTWLMNIFSFMAKRVRGQVPELETRLDETGEKLVTKIRANDVDEILVVGFSVGSILAVSIVARALQALKDPERDGQTGSGRPTLSLLTLGHCIPILGLHPQALVFRQELKRLALAQALRWIDFSSVTDWGSFALIDPVKICKVLPESPGESAMQANPLMRSPRFHTLFAPSSYVQLRRSKRRLHLQYLMATELTGEYDYFVITAGPLTLGARYADR